MGVDRILINKFITTAAVGIYNAYYLPSISVSLARWGIVNIAFFPFASKSKDTLGIFCNVNKAVRYYYSDAILLSQCNIAKNLLYISVLR
jgi:O-antigen/teichoic acid export membrane protein